MASLEANKARLKGAKELKPRDLASGDLGGTLLSEILMAIQELLADKDPKVVIGQIRVLPELPWATATPSVVPKAMPSVG